MIVEPTQEKIDAVNGQGIGIMEFLKYSAGAAALFACISFGGLFFPANAMSAQTHGQRDLEKKVEKWVEWKNKGFGLEKSGSHVGAIYDAETWNDWWKNSPQVDFGRMTVLYVTDTGDDYDKFEIEKIISKPELIKVRIKTHLSSKKIGDDLSTNSHVVVIPHTKKRIDFYVNGHLKKTSYYKQCQECSEIFDGVQVKVESDKSQYSLNEKIILNYEIRNDGKESKLIIHDKALPSEKGEPPSYLIFRIINSKNDKFLYGTQIMNPDYHFFGGSDIHIPVPGYIILKPLHSLKGSLSFLDLAPENFMKIEL